MHLLLANGQITQLVVDFGYTNLTADNLLLQCAVSTDYNLYCWGHDQHGELGINKEDGRGPTTLNALLYT